MARSNRSGFTLVELLVVIAIISVLAAMLLPVLEEARAEALRISCLNRLRQTHLAVSSYANDHSGALPPATSYYTSNGTWSWPMSFNYRVGVGGSAGGAVGAFLHGYMDRSLLSCPLGAASVEEDLFHPPPTGTSWTFGNYSYMWNYRGLIGIDGPKTLSDSTDDQHLASDVGYWWDGSAGPAWRTSHPTPDVVPDTTPLACYWIQTTGGSRTPLPDVRSNAIFLDGHGVALSLGGLRDVALVSYPTKGFILVPDED